MNLAIPINDNSADSAISEKFARSNYFALFNFENKAYTITNNPFAREEKMAGKKVFEYLIHKNNIDCFVAFELGLKIQQLAQKEKIQLIILSSKQLKLKQLIKYLTRTGK